MFLQFRHLKLVLPSSMFSICVCVEYNHINVVNKMAVISHWQKNTLLPFIFSSLPSCFWSVVHLTDVF